MHLIQKCERGRGDIADLHRKMSIKLSWLSHCDGTLNVEILSLKRRQVGFLTVHKHVNHPNLIVASIRRLSTTLQLNVCVLIQLVTTCQNENDNENERLERIMKRWCSDQSISRNPDSD